MLYGLVIAVHVISCLVLIAAILLQAGRGGGLSEAFGGTSTQTIFGAKANVFLTRLTTVCAILFLVTCLLLGILTSRRGRSLMRLQNMIPQANFAPKTEKDVSLDEAKEDLPEAKPEPAPSE